MAFTFADKEPVGLASHSSDAFKLFNILPLQRDLQISLLQFNYFQTFQCTFKQKDLQIAGLKFLTRAHFLFASIALNPHHKTDRSKLFIRILQDWKILFVK